jgi:hypothetical protein
VERHKLQFRPEGEKPLFKLRLEVEIWIWKVFKGPELFFGMFYLGKTLRFGRMKFPMIRGLEA